MKRIILILIATTSLAHLFAQEYYFSSMTPEDSITIYKTDSESKRPPNAEELENLNFSKFLFPHYIRLGDSDTFSIPLDSIDPSFGDIYDNAVMIFYNDTVEFFDTLYNQTFFYGQIENGKIDFNCYMAHLSVKDGDLEENYSRWYTRYDQSDIYEFKDQLTYINDSLGILPFRLRLLEVENIVNVPDTAFLHALIDAGVDTNEDSLISYGEAEAVIMLDVSGESDNLGEIVDLTGIEAFIYLDSLYCGYNEIASLDVSNNTQLSILSCQFNQLTSLDVSNNTLLSKLNCSSNQLAGLDVSNNKELTEIFCVMNQLTSLDVSSNTKLRFLLCSLNYLTSLVFSDNTALQLLYCDSNELTSLNVSECSGLQVLYCGMNSLTTIDITNNTDLWAMRCQGNQLTELDCSKNINLEVLVCEENMISSLDLSEHVDLTTLVCGKNLIEHLDLSNNILLGTGFAWKENQLDLQHMPSLHEVCVWTSDFPPVGLNIDTTGSPNVCFETDCDGDCSNVGFEVSRLSELSVYPNPTGGLLFIETGNPELYSIDVSSMNGQLIFKGEMEGTTQQIDLSTFQKGVYFITIRSKDFVTTRKIIKLGNF